MLHSILHNLDSGGKLASVSGIEIYVSGHRLLGKCLFAGRIGVGTDSLTASQNTIAAV